MSPAPEHLEEMVRKAARENPDLPVGLIRDILIARQEEPIEDYQFSPSSISLH